MALGWVEQSLVLYIATVLFRLLWMPLSMRTVLLELLHDNLFQTF